MDAEQLQILDDRAFERALASCSDLSLEAMEEAFNYYHQEAAGADRRCRLISARMDEIRGS